MFVEPLRARTMSLLINGKHVADVDSVSCSVATPPLADPLPGRFEIRMPLRITSSTPVDFDITPTWWKGAARTFESAAKCATRLAEIAARWSKLNTSPDASPAQLGRLLLGASTELASGVRSPHLRLSALLIDGHTAETLEPGRLWLVEQLNALVAGDREPIALESGFVPLVVDRSTQAPTSA